MAASWRGLIAVCPPEEVDLKLQRRGLCRLLRLLPHRHEGLFSTQSITAALASRSPAVAAGTSCYSSASLPLADSPSRCWLLFANLVVSITLIMLLVGKLLLPVLHRFSIINSNLNKLNNNLAYLLC